METGVVLDLRKIVEKVDRQMGEGDLILPLDIL